MVKVAGTQRVPVQAGLRRQGCPRPCRRGVRGKGPWGSWRGDGDGATRTRSITA